MRPSCHSLLLMAWLAAATGRAAVWVYPAPAEEFRSPEYAVTVIQDGHAHTSFVYAHECQDEKLRASMSDFNHWTTFSFAGQVTVTVTRLTADATGCVVRPTARGVQPTVSGRTATFALDRPAKLFVSFPGAEENPLFVFADAPETNVPDRKDPNVIWFEAGKVTDIGERYMIKSGQTVYLPGGAYVKGSIAADGASHIAVRGRGILSGFGYPRRAGPSSIPYNTVQFDGPGTDQTVEGITITNPTHFCILSRGTIAVRNVKLFGWWHQTDGWGGGDDSSVVDSFMKVNDDSVKFYGANQVARDLVIFQQVNGAPFQLGWGGAQQVATHCLAENIDIVRSEAIQRVNGGERNLAFLNLRRQNAASVIDGVTIRNVRIEGDIVHLLGLSAVNGQVRNIVLRDIAIAGKILRPNYLRTEGAGSIEGVRIENVRADGVAVDGQNGAEWSTTGNVAPLAFAGPPAQ